MIDIEKLAETLTDAGYSIADIVYILEAVKFYPTKEVIVEKLKYMTEAIERFQEANVEQKETI